MEFSLTTLGTASALPNVKRYPSAHVLNIHGRLFLIDCGEGCQIQLRRYGFSFAKIDNIFISHLHGDHIFGIFGLLSTMMMIGRTAPLYIYAPRKFASVINFFKSNFGDGLRYEIIHTPLKCIEPEMQLQLRTLEVYAFPMNHKIDTYGFLFKEKKPQRNIVKWRVGVDDLKLKEIAMLKKGENVTREDGTVLDVEKYTYQPYEPRSFAYCCDTAPFEKLSEWVSGVDILYHEATFGSDLHDIAQAHFHSTARQASETAVKGGVKKMVIGHYSSRYPNLNVLLDEARELFPDTFLAEEGMKFEIELKKNQYE